jgi:hypothetical protein
VQGQGDTGCFWCENTALATTLPLTTLAR